MFYYPKSPEYDSYINLFAAANSNRTGTPFSVSTTTLTDPNFTPATTDKTVIYPVASQDFIYDYALKYPNRTRWAVTFDTANSGAGASAFTNVRYQVWFNASLTANSSDIFGRQLLSVVRGMDEAISKYHSIHPFHSIPFHPIPPFKKSKKSINNTLFKHY
jgi:hypothetical protein